MKKFYQCSKYLENNSCHRCQEGSDYCSKKHGLLHEHTLNCDRSPICIEIKKFIKDDEFEI